MDGAVDFYLFAHTDDWPLFMGDRAYDDIKAGHKVVFVYVVAGYSRPNWQAWENASNAAVMCAVDDDCRTNASNINTPKCTETNIDGHSIHRCSYAKTVSYFLRLPDGADFGGDNGGSGWPADNYQSLRKLQDGAIDSISAVDGKTRYVSFVDLYRTLRQIIASESKNHPAPSIWINSQNPNTKANPHDNSDHTSTGCAVSNAVRGLWANQRIYVDYDNRNQASELPPQTIKIKRRLALQFNDELKKETGIDLYSKDWDSWLAHTVSTVETASLPPETNILTYNAAAGEGSFYALEGRCDLTLKRRYPSWRKSWTFIVPGNFTGTALSDLVFYDHETGEGALLINKGNGVFDQKPFDKWRKTWTQVLPGNFLGDGGTQLLFYDASAGEAAIYDFDQQGNMKLKKEFNGWRHTWEFIIPGDFGGDGHTDLVFYDRIAGAGYVFINDGNASFASPSVTYGQWRKSWTMIIPGNFGGHHHTDLLFYDAPRGLAALLINDGKGTFVQTEISGWRVSWGAIVPGRFLEESPKDDLLFYDVANNEIAIFKIGDNGEILNSVKEFKVFNRPPPARWDGVIAGKFLLPD
jgi:hypothetical protein